MPEIAYLAGYGGHKPAKTPRDLRTVMYALDAELIDIRFTPFSRWHAEWNRSSLQQLFGTRYHSIQYWGNPNHANGKPIEIADFKLGWAIVSQIARPVILLCACHGTTGCHREIVGDMLTSRGLCEVREIDWSAGADTGQTGLSL